MDSSLHELASAIILRRTTLFIARVCQCNYSARNNTLHCMSLPVQLFCEGQHYSLHEFASAIILRETILFIACNYLILQQEYSSIIMNHHFVFFTILPIRGFHTELSGSMSEILETDFYHLSIGINSVWSLCHLTFDF
jgi:hypothetical protein